MNDTKNFVFYDYETFGTNTALDKIAQFSCIKTDNELNIVSKPNILYCKPPIDYLPNPESVLITKITPQDVFLNHGILESDFAKKIYLIFTKRNTCIVGFNNINFDDEMTRNLFYRNFFDPYEWSWKFNNSRWDIINVLRACYVMCPIGFIWPKNELGFAIFNLSKFTKLNNIHHVQAHDALSDVYATILIAKLLKQKKSKLFNFLFLLRKKENVLQLINYPEVKKLIYVSNIFGSKNNNMSIIVSIIWHPKNSNALIFFDLKKNIFNLLRLFEENSIDNITLSQLITFGISFLYINKCPSLFLESVFKNKDYYRLSINKDIILNNFNIFKKKINYLKKKFLIFFQLKIFFQFLIMLIYYYIVTFFLIMIKKI